MFEASKILAPLLDPRTVVFLGLLLGTILLWTRARRWGRALVSLAMAVSLFFIFVPVGTWLMTGLEDRFPAATPPARVDGIVVLGGDFDTQLTLARGPTSTGGMGVPRLIAFADLARRYPEARLIFTGGPGRLFDPELKDAAGAVGILRALGVDPARVVFEDESRNTAENAAYSLRLAAPQPGQAWLLVTSAFHMPRSIGCFRRVGWATIRPWPVGYMTVPGFEGMGGLYFDGGMGVLTYALHEWIGLIAYRLLDRTDAVFPGP
jgi:uncharacterized SAM-binding protein YcdF (DUF218 family)